MDTQSKTGAEVKLSLYKYVIPCRIDVLAYGRIRFTQSSALNDPFEMQPVFQKYELSREERDEAENSRKEFRDKIANRLDPILRARITEDMLDGLVETYLRGGVEFDQQMLEKVRKDLNDSIGVLSLTEKPDDLPMWAHYAQDHQGFVIEFDETDSFFNKGPASLPHTEQLIVRRPSDECGYLRKVEYSRDRPSHLSVLDLTSSMVLQSKSKEWQYEQEWRMLQPLEDADKVEPKESGNIYLFSMPPSCVKGVILGYKMSEENKNRILDLRISDKRYSHLKVSRPILNERKYALDLIEI